MLHDNISELGLLICIGGLIGLGITIIYGRRADAVKTSLVISAVGGLAWVIARALN